MKITVFIPSLTGGGAERVAVALANEFAALGHQTALLVATNAPPKYEDEVNGSVSLHFFGASRTIKSTLGLAMHIQKNRPDAVLAIMEHASVTASFAISISGRTKNTRFFVREAISLEFKEAQFNSRRHMLKKIIKEALVRRVYKTADGVISPSHVLGLALENKYSPGIKVNHINNPVISKNFTRLAAQKIELPWNATQATLVAAGRFTAQKNFLCLLQAFNLVRARVDCKLILLGTGPEKSNIDRYIETNNLSEHCHMPGFVNNPLPYFATADVFVLSSNYEGLPNVLIQALACGTAAVSTDCPTGPKEILKNGKYGTLVPVDDYVKLAYAIEGALETLDSEKQSQIASIVRKTYDSKEIAKKYISLVTSSHVS